MVFGIAALFLLAVRVVLGFVGSRYARFSSYPVHPREIVGYMISAAVSKSKLYAGNNPGSAMAAMLMFLLCSYQASDMAGKPLRSFTKSAPGRYLR